LAKTASPLWSVLSAKISYNVIPDKNTTEGQEMAGQNSNGGIPAVLKCYGGARKPLRFLLLTLLILISAALFTPTSLAADDGHDPLLTFYYARGADPDFFNILPELIRGESMTDDTYLYALSYFHPLTTPGGLQKVFDFLRVPNTRTGIEGVVGKHNGLQHNWEVGATWQLRFAPWRLAMVRVRPAVGIGLSCAIGDPAYEDGPEHDPEKRYHLLNFNIYELEWGLQKVPAISLVTRLHHRSGIWGVIAPPLVGSNFLAVGLRYRF
jgi:hypothetical protein